MKAAALALVAVLGLGAGCGSPVTQPSTPPLTVPSTGAAAPDAARSGIPRVEGDDVVPPQITTRTTVIQDRPAVVVTLPDAVLFAFGSAELRPDAEPALRSLLDLFHRYAGAEGEVAGHTDSVGSDAYNLALSQRRASAVVDWLVDHGVPRTRLHATGYGAGQPVAPNDTDENRQRNRRVELTVRAA